MKLKLLFTFLILCSTINFAQEIIVSFQGKDNNSNSLPISEVVIDNLTTGKSVKITETTTALNLNTVLSLNNFDILKSMKGIQNVYPNPVTSEANIDFYSEGVSKSLLIVYDLQGKEITRLAQNFEKGNNSVKFIPGKIGVYFVKLVDAGKSFHSKVIASRSEFASTSLTYKGNSSKKESKNISQKTDAFFTAGDVLRFTATSGTFKSTIYDSPKSSKTITFTFTEEFYKFDSYLVETEYPSFVNILFSVTDKKNKGVDYLENTDFEVLENGNAISPSESFRYVKKLNQVPSKQKTVLMLDKSFSIRNDLPKIKQAALSLINQIADDQEIAIYAFSEAPILITDFTSDKAILEAAVNFIEVDFPTTNLYGSIITGLSRINNSYTLDGIEEGYLVVLTDGDDTQASSTLEEVITARGNKKVFMMGLGSDLNEDNLNEIAFPGNYVNAVNADELEDKFKQVRLDMLRFSNSFYWLNYMTPKRNSSNSLTVKAKTNTNTEIDKEITSTFSADGFESILFGVYANVEVGKKYGIEKLDIIINGSNPVFPVDFKAITFWAEDVPKFTWEIDNNDDFNLSINPNDDSKAILEILNNKYSVGNKLTLKDITNNYEKVIDVNLLTTLPALNVDTIYVKSRDFKVKGELLYQGQSEITEKGFKIYNENTGLIRDIKLDVNQSFEATVNGSSLILPNKYHSVVAYAKNTQGQGFSKRIYFLTKEATPLVNNTWQSFKVKAKSFKARGFLIDNGGLEIEEVGIVWSKTSEYPTIEDSKVMGNFTNLTSDNDFEAIIDNLEISTLYYFRSYAKNAKGISYSNILKQQNAIGKVITTNGLIESNVIGTQERKVDIDKATFSGNFGTNEVIVKTGFVWSETEELPELMNSNFTEINPNITESDFNKDNYELEGDIENLKPDTKYYIRLFIETDIGISYGNVLTFTTKKLFLSTQMSMSAESGKSIRFVANINEFSNDFEITSQGFVYSKTNQTPTLADTVIAGNIAKGNTFFQVSITTEEVLEPDTTYFGRLFFETKFGTYYSDVKSVKTKNGIISLSNLSFTNLGTNYIDVRGFVGVENGLPILDKGFVYSTSNNPTIDSNSLLNRGFRTNTRYMEARISGLNPNTIYYIRMVVQTELGYQYSDAISVRTNQ